MRRYAVFIVSWAIVFAPIAGITILIYALPVGRDYAVWQHAVFALFVSFAITVGLAIGSTRLDFNSA